MTDEPTFRGVPLGEAEKLYPSDAKFGEGDPRYYFISPEAAENMNSHRPPDRWETVNGQRVPIWECGPK